MLRVVLDTNVLVAASISSTGPNAQIIDLVVADKIRPYVTAAVLENMTRCLGMSTYGNLIGGEWLMCFGC